MKNIVIFILSILIFPFKGFAIWNGRPLASDEVDQVFRYSVSREACTGILIQKKWVLSAGHCFEEAGFDPQVKMKIYSSSSVKQFTEVTPKRVHLHPNYRKGFASNVEIDKIQDDLVVFEMPEGVFPKKIKGNFHFEVGLNKNADLLEILKSTQIGTAIAAGDSAPKQANGILQKIEQNLSVELLQTQNILLGRALGQNQSTCEGDSGGGLFVTVDNVNVLIGVISSKTAGNCGQNNIRTAYALLSENNLAWIKSVIGDLL